MTLRGGNPVAVWLRGGVATGLLVGCLLPATAPAQPAFPDLTGRVMDNAGLLDEAAEQRISQLLAGHENAAGNQVVVVTLPDLGGYDIASYGYQLGRHWGIGQAGEDNGVLLIVAQAERKVRIEVGYGLEGTLTDAISANIINTIILPNFKQGQFAAGIEAGTAAIIQALGGEYEMTRERSGNKSAYGLFQLIMLLVFILFGFIGNLGRGFGRRRGIFYGGYGGGYRSGGGGGFGGGFSGGGGGFGGGGASGGW